MVKIIVIIFISGVLVFAVSRVVKILKKEQDNTDLVEPLEDLKNSIFKSGLEKVDKVFEVIKEESPEAIKKTLEKIYSLVIKKLTDILELKTIDPGHLSSGDSNPQQNKSAFVITEDVNPSIKLNPSIMETATEIATGENTNRKKPKT